MNNRSILIAAALLLIGGIGGYLLGHSPAQREESAQTSSAPMHAEGRYDVPASEKVPTISLEPLKDSKSGWNLHIITTNFTYDPANAGEAAVPGRGHVHVFVDGKKLGRAYADWYYAPELSPGEHTFKVEIVTNDHKVYYVDGAPVETSVTVTQPSATPSAAAKVFELTVKGGKVVSGSGDISVSQGDTVTLRVTNDTDEELHVHAYDKSVELKAGEPSELTFVANASGRFPFELERSKTDIGALSVMPR